MADIVTTQEQRYKKQVERLVSTANEVLNEEEIRMAGEEIVSGQLEAETAHEWRENFLADNGTSGAAFAERAACVADHEPVLRRSDNKETQSMYDKVTSKYKKSRKKLDKENQKVRKQIDRESRRQQQDFPLLVRSKNLFAADQFGVLREAADALYQAKLKKGEKSPEGRAMEIVYLKLHAASEVEASYMNELRAYAELMDDKDVVKNADMQEEVRRRIEVLRQRRDLAENRRRDLIGAMRALKKAAYGTPVGELDLTEREKEVLRQFYDLGQRTQQDAIVEGQAGLTLDAENAAEEKIRHLMAEKLGGEGVPDEAGWRQLLKKNRHYVMAAELDDTMSERLATQLVHSLRGAEETAEDMAVVGDTIRAYRDMIFNFDAEPYLRMFDRGDWGGLMRSMGALAKFEFIESKVDLLGRYMRPETAADPKWDLARLAGIGTDDELLLMYKGAMLRELSSIARMHWYAEAKKRGVEVTCPQFDERLGNIDWRLHESETRIRRFRGGYNAQQAYHLGHRDG